MNDECISDIKKDLHLFIDNILSSQIIYTKPGSITYLLYGKKPSEQSINIKIGRLGELLAKELIKASIEFELLICGIQKINNKNKDVDLLFINKKTKIIYYRELKGNVELDTEKMIATIDKCKEIEKSLKMDYIDYDINYGILNWSVYNRQNLINNRCLFNIKIFEKNGIKIEHIENFLQIINILWEEDDYYLFFKEIGNKITQHNF